MKTLMTSLLLLAASSTYAAKISTSEALKEYKKQLQEGIAKLAKVDTKAADTFLKKEAPQLWLRASQLKGEERAELLAQGLEIFIELQELNAEKSSSSDEKTSEEKKDDEEESANELEECKEMLKEYLGLINELCKEEIKLITLIKKGCSREELHQQIELLSELRQEIDSCCEDEFDDEMDDDDDEMDDDDDEMDDDDDDDEMDDDDDDEMEEDED